MPSPKKINKEFLDLSKSIDVKHPNLLMSNSLRSLFVEHFTIFLIIDETKAPFILPGILS